MAFLNFFENKQGVVHPCRFKACPKRVFKRVSERLERCFAGFQGIGGTCQAASLIKIHHSLAREAGPDGWGQKPDIHHHHGRELSLNLHVCDIFGDPPTLTGFSVILW